MLQIFLLGGFAYLFYRYVKKNYSGVNIYEVDSVSDEATFYGKHLSSDFDTLFIREILDAEFPYFSEWPERDKLKFIWRTGVIRNNKHFHGSEGFEITPRHEIIVSATLARLTMGLSKFFDLPQFELIEIYPREFYSKLIDRHVKGLTIGNGRLFLSWEHFEEGHEDPTDKIHVGLHEFAHAMMIQFESFEYTPQWDDWCEAAHPIIRSMSLTGNHFFRQYGATNIHEFWAVTVETFFEQPHDFKRYHPVLFEKTCAMLNQWPLKHRV